MLNPNIILFDVLPTSWKHFVSILCSPGKFVAQDSSAGGTRAHAHWSVSFEFSLLFLAGTSCWFPPPWLVLWRKWFAAAATHAGQGGPPLSCPLLSALGVFLGLLNTTEKGRMALLSLQLPDLLARQRLKDGEPSHWGGGKPATPTSALSLLLSFSQGSKKIGLGAERWGIPRLFPSPATPHFAKAVTQY